MDDDKTHYQVLGLRPDAKHTEIGIAYQRIMGKRHAETAPPDPRGDARIREAYETLSDLEAREYYDAELRSKALREPIPKWRIAALAAAVLAVAGAGWYVMRPNPAAKLEAEAPTRVAQAAAPAVGRIERLMVSGKATESGVAFATREGVLVTSCHRMAPGTQLIVTMLGRKIPATVRTHDEKTGLCQLEAPNTGSWPLVFTAIVPKPGDRVFSARVNAKGEVALREGQVKRIVDTPQGRAVETTLPVGNDGAGAPLFDAQARVAAVATYAPDGKELHLLPPEEWRGPMTDRSAAGKAAAEAEARAKQEALDEAAKPKMVDDLGRPMGKTQADSERKRALEKAFRPPPNVPDDL